MIHAKPARPWSPPPPALRFPCQTTDNARSRLHVGWSATASGGYQRAKRAQEGGRAPFLISWRRRMGIEPACRRMLARVRVRSLRSNGTYGSRAGSPSGFSTARRRAAGACASKTSDPPPPFDSHAFPPKTREAGFTPASSPSLPVPLSLCFHPFGGGAWESNLRAVGCSLASESARSAPTAPTVPGAGPSACPTPLRALALRSRSRGWGYAASRPSIPMLSTRKSCGGGAWESNPPAGGLAPVQRL